MTRPFTVYFDTSFFVRLCKVEDFAASKTIDDLNALEVRYVLSDLILQELLTSGRRSDKDKLLVERVNKFQLTPYKVNKLFHWETLLISGQERIALANLLKLMDDMITIPESWSIVARRSKTPEQDERLIKASGYDTQGKDFPSNIIRDILSSLTVAQEALKDFEGFPEDTLAILKAIKTEDLIASVDPTSKESCENASANLLKILGDSTIARLNQENSLQDSVTSSETRPYEVAVGDADHKTAKKLANTLRDAKHMDLFITHKEEIDLLQVDRPQMNLINEMRPPHYLVEVGLANRCFSAASLQEAVETIAKLKTNG